MNNPGVSELLGAVFLAVAVIHSFAIKWFQHLAQKFPDGSLLENLFHLLGEVEIVFGFWSFWLLLLLASLTGGSTVLEHLESLNFNEPLFVFVIMTMAATKPILSITQRLISWVSRWLPLGKDCSFLIATLTLGPLFGSLITEPAAMTVTAFILKDRFFDRTQSESFKYLTLAVLFVNISIGGTLTPYAAPPVLMVSSQWGWDLSFMLAHFGWRAALTVFLNSLILGALFRKELSALQASLASDDRKTPIWLIAIHVLFLSLVTLSAHHAVIFIGLFLFFLGLVSITKEHQIDLKIKESLLVSFFLGGLVVLGSFQRWWLEPLLNSLSSSALYFGSTGLTAFLDNAALTYLGSQVPHITNELKYALVAGAVTGGGLTVIANAPNPAGFSILNSTFGPEGISPTKLFVYAILPTLVTIMFFWVV